MGGNGGGREARGRAGERRAETGAPMAPKMGVSSQVPSVLNDHTGGGLGGRGGAGVP